MGHDEYWSREMRDSIEGRIASGKNVAFLGGNTCWWQIRFSPAFDQIICYKDKTADPFMGIDNSRVTINWFQAPVNRPENSMTGVSFRNGGYVNSGFCMPASEGYGGYRVSRADHWIYAGTGLAEGEIFGQAATIVGYEVDGTRMHWTGGLPVPSGGDGTPSSFAILATSEACGSSLETEPGLNRAATMGLYTAGGAVFSAATIDWCAGLASDPAFQRITRNVMDRLLDLNWVVGVPEDASNPTLSPAPRLTAFPNPFGSTTGVRVDLPRAGEIQLDVFDIQGRRIRELFRGPAASGTREIPWDGTDEQGRPVGPGIYFYRLQSDAPPVLARTVRIQAPSHPS